jgi:hypothetical protein
MMEPDQLIKQLNRIGVHFLMGEGNPELGEVLSPAGLLAELTQQPDARLRLALIAVLLQHPEYSGDAGQVLGILDEPQRLIFMLYYSAAQILQNLYAQQLQAVMGKFIRLPDCYSETLKIAVNVPAKEQLRQLARRHQEITGLHLNWHGTYVHAANRVIRRLRLEEKWNKA